VPSVAAPTDDVTARSLANLTRRDREVLSLVADGQSNAEIAAQLGISDRTAKRHIANVLDRLGLPTRGAPGRTARVDLRSCRRADELIIGKIL
jgi:DNA-binding NarL/FixJ family response regulator